MLSSSYFAGFVLMAALLAGACAFPSRVAAGGGMEATVAIDRVTLTGARRTREETVRALLPRPPPALYTEAELRESERRIGNLGIFDDVALRRVGRELEISVREKWTLIPTFDLATGKTLADLYIALGATEYNLLGTATSVGVTVYREQRGLGFSAEIEEHQSRHHRFSYALAVAYESQSRRFEGGRAWFDTGPEIAVRAISPPVLSPHLRFAIAGWYSHERIEQVEGDVHTPSGHAMQPAPELIWDAYHFHDLVPRGVKAYLGGGPGLFVPARQGRHWAELEVIGALPLARYTVLTTRLTGALKNRGNANHSYLMGSIYGVRGLEDALYRNWLQGFGNLELRQAIPLWERLALQLVAFSDVGGFEQLTARGGRGDAELALSTGLGARIVPTFLTQLLLRVDVARLLVPEETWFVQLGVSQYFF